MSTREMKKCWKETAKSEAHLNLCTKSLSGKAGLHCFLFFSFMFWTTLSVRTLDFLYNAVHPYVLVPVVR